MALLLGSLKSRFKRFDRVYVRVAYSKDYENRGCYTSFADLYRAWRAFIEVEEDFA